MPLLGSRAAGSVRGYGRFALMGNRPIRYIRWYVNGSTSNGSSHFVECKAVNAAGTNYALNAGNAGRVSQYTGAGPEQGMSNSVWNVITNDNTSSNDYIGFSPGGCGIQIDLGAIYNDITQLQFWNYYLDGRSYYSFTISISTDGTNWTTVYGPTTQGSSSGVYITNPKL